MDSGAVGFSVFAMTQDEDTLDTDAFGDELVSKMTSSRCWPSAMFIRGRTGRQKITVLDQVQCFGKAWHFASSTPTGNDSASALAFLWDKDVLGEETNRLTGANAFSLALRLKPPGFVVGLWLASYIPDPSITDDAAACQLKDLLVDIHASRDHQEPILLVTTSAQSQVDALKSQSFSQVGHEENANSAICATSFWVGGATEALRICSSVTPPYPLTSNDSAMVDIRMASAQPKVDCRAGYFGFNFVWRNKLEQDVLDLLVNDFDYTSSFPSLKERMHDASTAFRDNCNPFHPKGHFYFEADYHGLATPLGVESMPVARQFYHLDKWTKKSLPQFTRAFFKSFHELNKPLFSMMLQSAPGDMDCMKSYLEEDRFFSCVSAQFRCGTATPIKAPATWLHLPEGDEKKKNKYGWHMDWCPSIFHMAISLRGTRIVHAMIDGRTDEPKSQSAGDVYIGCPGFFDHAVEFLEMSDDAPVLSLQARTLVPSRTAYADFSKTDFKRLRAHICNVLQTGEFSFVLPNRQQVLNALQQIEGSSEEKPSKLRKLAPTT